jgi:hypothetical protein
VFKISVYNFFFLHFKYGESCFDWSAQEEAILYILVVYDNTSKQQMMLLISLGSLRDFRENSLWSRIRHVELKINIKKNVSTGILN